MILNEMIELAVENYYECRVWRNVLEKNVFKGKISDIPENLLDREITSWEIEDGIIIFNVD